jgi:hypothetical protein
LRDPAVAMITHLTVNAISLVQGPPGSGKSSMAWLWACQEAASGKSVLWIHLDELGGNICLMRDNDCQKYISTIDRVTEILDNCNENILVLDGLVQLKHDSFISHASVWVQTNSKKKLVLVSSLQLILKQETIKVHQISEFKMPSWTIEEYNTALQNKLFKESVIHILPGDSLQEKIDDKYFLAGGCARWMFEFTVDEVISEIKGHVARVESDLNLLIMEDLATRLTIFFL